MTQTKVAVFGSRDRQTKDLIETLVALGFAAVEFRSEILPPDDSDEPPNIVGLVFVMGPDNVVGLGNAEVCKTFEMKWVWYGLDDALPDNSKHLAGNGYWKFQRSEKGREALAALLVSAGATRTPPPEAPPA